jgi:hypothetical protein
LNLKLRSDSVIGALPPAQRQLIEQWLFKENISYREASKRYLADFHKSITVNCFYTYFRRYQTQHLIENIGSSAHMASALAAKFKEDKFCEALSVLTGQMAFEKALSVAPASPDETPEPPPEGAPPAEALSSPPAQSDAPASTENDSPRAESKNRPSGRRRRANPDALAEAASLFSTALKLRFAKEGMALERKRFELEFQKHQDHVAQQKGKIHDALHTGKRKKGGISEAALREIEEACNLL